MDEFSGLRVFGVAVALVFFTIFLKKMRAPRPQRTGTGILAFAAIAIFIASLFPSVAGIPAGILAFGDQKFARIVTLLILAVVTLWFLVFVNRSRLETQRKRFQRLVSAQTRASVTAPTSSDTENSADSIGEILVVTPVLNEESNLNLLLPEIPKTVDGMSVSVLVMDDGSDDKSFVTALEHGAWVARLPVTMGGGTALHIGFEIAAELGATYIVTMDGDRQHDPSDMHVLLDPVKHGTADICVGSRLLGAHEHVSVMRTLGMYVFGFFISFLLGVRVTDPSSGYRAIRASVLPQLTLLQEQYHTAELLIESAKNGYRIVECPVTIRRRTHGKSKKGKDILYGVFFLRTIIKSWLR